MNALVINDVVNRTNTSHPTGTIEDIRGNVATVRWGIQDKFKFTEDIPLDELQEVSKQSFGPNGEIISYKPLVEEESK